MTCNCDNDGSNEYIIELNQQGAPGVKGEQGEQGYSPVVDYTSDNNALQLHIVNEQNTVTTPEIPLKSYTDTQLAGKLNKDGSNADSNITLNGIKMYKYGAASIITTPSSTLNIVSASNNNIYIQASGTGKLYYTHDGYSTPSNEIATIGDIPSVGNGTITIAQGGVTKGTFTTNQSGNTTINLDASGASNPLEIKTSDGTRVLSLGVDNSTKKADIYYGIVGEGSTSVVPILPIYQVASPLTATDNGNGLYSLSVNTMTGSDSITGGAAGLVPAPAAGDQNKFLKGDGTWDTVGGGGSSYVEGKGININSDTISVDDIQNFTRLVMNHGYQNGYGIYAYDLEGTHTIRTVGVSGLDDVIIGDENYGLQFFGSGTRPSYWNGTTNATIALTTDIPSVSSFLEASDITTGTTNGTIAVDGTDIAVYGLGSAAYTSSSDYMDLTSNQNVGGNKTFTGTNYLRNTYICNASGTYFGRMRAVDNKFTFEGIGTNRSINFIPDGTGELQYNGNKVATESYVNSIVGDIETLLSQI